MTNTELTPRTPEFDLADRCVKARDVAGLSQQQLAERTGISVSTITRYETRKTTRPSRLVLRQWAFACGVDFEWLKDGVTSGEGRPGGGEQGTGDLEMSPFGWRNTSARQAA